MNFNQITYVTIDTISDFCGIAFDILFFTKSDLFRLDVGLTVLLYGEQVISIC